MRFHSYHGKNIELLKEGTVAHRRFSFANSIAFSERPLKPYELFLLEINSNEFGWSGHLRFGLTVMDPGQQPALPFYALPDLNASGKAWIFAITCSVGRHNLNNGNHICGIFNSRSENEQHQRRRASSFLLTNQNGDEGAGPSRVADQSDTADVDPMPPVPPFLQILATNSNTANGDFVQKGAELIDGGRVRLPTDVGSRIGVYYEVSADNGDGSCSPTAEMHFVINGVDQGATSAHIPFNGRPLYAIVDVYGTTKQVEIVQSVQTVNSLQHSCRICILKYVPYDLIGHLPLPEKLKYYLYRPYRYH